MQFRKYSEQTKIRMKHMDDGGPFWIETDGIIQKVLENDTYEILIVDKESTENGKTLVLHAQQFYLTSFKVDQSCDHCRKTGCIYPEYVESAKSKKAKTQLKEDFPCYFCSGRIHTKLEEMMAALKA